MYVKALSILLLLSGLIAGAWKLYDAGGDAREDKLVRKWQEERLALIQERDAAMLKAAENKVKREVIYREKIRTVYQASDACLDTPLPPGVLRPLCEVGLATKELCESEAIRQ